MWKFIRASCEGTSHRRAGSPCQDYAVADAVQGTGGTVFVAACSDGAGSASLSEVGSRLACEAALRQVTAALADGLSVGQIDRDRVLSWHREVLHQLEAEAEARGAGLRDLACTLLLALVGETDSAFSQLGDGAIVVPADSDYRTVFWPQSGEYVNTTNFLTDRHWEERLEFATLPGAVDEVALFTDGLQALVLNYAARTAHTPFFAPLFGVLRNAPSAAELSEPLRRFLDSARVNERTDDDKTLVLATRRAPDVPPQVA